LAAARPAPLPPSARLSLALRAVAGPGWRASLARGRQAWRDSSDERRLEAALAAAPPARCARVGVVGATPGAGATTVAVLLAAVLAAVRPGRTVAVDASPGRGSLTELLAPHHDLFADELLGLLEHPRLTRRELGAVLARRGDLAVLAARPGTGQPDERGWTRVSRALARHATTVVVDCGPGTTAGARAALAGADQIVLVADACSPRTAVAAADLLAERGRRPVLLLNRAPGDLEAGEVVQRVAGVRGAVVLPADPAAAAALGTVPLPADPAAAAAVRAAPTPGAPGAPLGRVALSARWRRQADELAMLLAAEWPSLGLEAG
jgi:MinD-like ATPase involved in chromosome partitioning or flagellar assembly